MPRHTHDLGDQSCIYIYDPANHNLAISSPGTKGEVRIHNRFLDCNFRIQGVAFSFEGIAISICSQFRMLRSYP
jgi:hypothetical protein